MYNLWEIAFQISGRLEKKTGDSDSHHVTRWQWWSKIYVWVYVSVLMCDKRSRIRCQQTQQPDLMNNMSNAPDDEKKEFLHLFFIFYWRKKRNGRESEKLSTSGFVVGFLKVKKKSSLNFSDPWRTTSVLLLLITFNHHSVCTCVAPQSSFNWKWLQFFFASQRWKIIREEKKTK